MYSISLNHFLLKDFHNIKSEYEKDIENGKKLIYEKLYDKYFDKIEKEKIEEQTSYIITSKAFDFTGIFSNTLSVYIILDMYNVVEAYLLSDISLIDYAIQLRLNKNFRTFLKFVVHLKSDLKPYTVLNQW